MKGDDTTLGALAQYFVKFVQAYATKGIHIELVLASERTRLQRNLPHVWVEPAAYATFVGKHLVLRSLAARSRRQIMLGTFNGGNPGRPDHQHRDG